MVNDGLPWLISTPTTSGGSVRSTFRTTFTENGAPVAIADIDVTVTDADSPTLASATITLANPHTGDLLTVVGPCREQSSRPATTRVPASSRSRSRYRWMNTNSRYSRFPTAQRRRSRHGRPPHRGRGQRRGERQQRGGRRDRCRGSERRAHARGSRTPPTQRECHPGIAVAGGKRGRPGRYRSQFRRRADHCRLFSRRRRHPVPSTAPPAAPSNGITFTWNPTLHALVLTGASSVANYQALLQTVAFQLTSENPTDFGASPTTDADLVGIGWRDAYDHDDNARDHRIPKTTTRSIPCRARRASPRILPCRSPASRWRTATAARSPPRST